MKLLHLDSSILGDNSVSRKLSAELVKHLQSQADYSVTYRDLGAKPLSHLSGAYLAGQPADVKHDQALQEDLELGGAALDEFLASDTIVIGAPMYNFTIPSQLKAWIDRVLKAGSTFHYVDGKPEGLAAGKRVIVAVSRGGFYGDDTPYASYQHQEGLLRTVFGFMGIGDVRFIRAEGLARGPEQRERSIAAALADIHALPIAA